jgi:integrase
MPGGRPRKSVPAPERPPRRKPGTGSVSYHAPSKTWRAKLPPSVPYEPRETYHPTRELAVAWLDAECARHARSLAQATDADRVVYSGGMLLGDWLDRWFAMTAPSAGWAERTRQIYRDHIWQWSPVHDVPLAELTTTRLQEVVAALMTTGAARRPASRSQKPVAPLAPAGVREAISTLRRALARARDDGLLAQNPAAGLITPRVTRQKPSIWTTEERQKLAAVINGDDLEAVWRLLFECGLRIGEALGLRWECVDLDAGVFTVRRIVFKNGRVQEWPKGRRWRDVDLTRRAHDALTRLRDRLPADAVWVFEHVAPTRGQRPWTHQGVAYRAIWTYDGIRYRLQRLAKRAGVAYHPSHTGRHSHATKLLLDGVPAADVAERLGHADASVTLRLYASPSAEGRRRALASAETSLDG